MNTDLNGVKKNLSYNLFYQLLTIITPLITTPYVSRSLKADAVGKYGIAYACAHYFVLFTLLGLNNYGNKIVAKCRENKPLLSKTFWSIYTMQMMVSLVVIVSYIVFVILFAKDKILSWIMMLYVVSAGMDINWCFYGLEKFKSVVIRNSVIKIVSTILILLFVNNPNDVDIYTGIMAGSFFLSQAVLWGMVRKYIDFTRVKFKDIVPHFKPNLVLFIPAVAVSVYKIMDKLMLGFLSNDAEVGFYESSEKLTTIPLILITTVGTVMLPRMSNLVDRVNVDRIREIVSKSYVLSIFITCPMIAGMISITDILVPIYYGTGYEKCIYLFYIILPSTLFVGMANVIRTHLLIPCGRDGLYVKSIISGAIVNFVLNLLFIQYIQSIGAAIATLVTEIVVWAIQAYYVRNEIEFKGTIKTILGILFLSCIMGATVYFIPDIFGNGFLCLGTKIFVGFVLYILLLCLYILKTRDPICISLVNIIVPAKVKNRISK